MKNSSYWKKTALQREIAIQEGAEFTLKDILNLYDEALEDINTEIQKIKINFQRRFGIDNETASFFLDKAQNEENMKNLIKALEAAPDEKARNDILNFIQRDGLSVRAYSARTERYEAVKTEIYARIKRLAADEGMLLRDRLKEAYKESYYGVIDDFARGMNVGVNFSKPNERAIEEALSAKWSGSRFSERIWKNTDRLAEEAQRLVTKSIMTGESNEKTAQRLTDIFEVEKHNAVTLVRTETAHIRNTADFQAYEDLGVEEYKYLATLDYVTCSLCQPLDGMVFKVSEAIEGENCPVMHPRCRCTTTVNMSYDKRRAKDPITGKYKMVDGNVTYSEWVRSLSPEQKNALDTAKKKDSRRTSDKLQHEKYMKVLGTKYVPKSFDKFCELKYNKVDEWKELKKTYKTVGEINSKPWSETFKDKAKKTYFDFKTENIDMSTHAIARFLVRKDGTNGITYTFDDIKKQCHLSANYIQADGRFVKYYNKVAVIYDTNNSTVVSIVNRKNPKSDWRKQ